MDLHQSLEPQEPQTTPALSIILGAAPMLPLLAGALIAWLASPPQLDLIASAETLWAGAVLCFLAGVRRGLSFRTKGGARLTEIITMFTLFVLAAAGLALSTPLGLYVLAAGYILLGLADPAAARHGEAPPFFARLRPIQSGLATACLIAVALALRTR